MEEVFVHLDQQGDVEEDGVEVGVEGAKQRTQPAHLAAQRQLGPPRGGLEQLPDLRLQLLLRLLQLLLCCGLRLLRSSRLRPRLH